MRQRLTEKILIRVAPPAHDLVEHLANESDRTVSGMARRLLLERLAEIATERQQRGSAAAAA